MPEDTQYSQLTLDLAALRVIEQEELDAHLAQYAALPDVHHPQSHSHSTLGDINFTGTVSADGQPGLTGARTIDGHTLTFKDGLLVGYQAP